MATEAHGPLTGGGADHQRRETLETVRRALRLELHVLARHPELTWQQLHNQLQWSEGEASDLVGLEAARRAADGNRPIWFRTRTRFRESESLLRTLPHGAEVTACALTPNGARLAATGGGSLRLWDLPTGGEIACVFDLADPVVSCSFSCDASFLVTGSRSGRVRIRDARTPTELLETVALQPDAGPSKSAAYCVTSPVAPVAAIASGTVLRLVELPSGRELASAVAKDGAFSCLAFSGGGDLIVTGDDAGTMRVWVWSASRLHERGCVIHAHVGRIRGCAVAPNFAYHTTAGDDTVAMWGFGNGGELQKAPHRLFDQVNDCCISPDGSLLAAVSDDQMVWIQTIADLRGPVSVLEGHDAPVNCCAFAADGSVLATGSRDGTVKIWDPWRGPSRGGISGHHERVTAVAYAPDGSFIVSASADQTLKTWHPAPTAERTTLEGHDATVRACIVLQGGSLIASSSEDGTIRLWDVAAEHEMQALSEGPWVDPVHALAANSDGRLLAAGCTSSVRLWELATGRCLVEGDLGGVHDCAFTSDDSRLLWACEDATIRIWDVATWREMAVLRGHAGPVYCCAAIPESSLAVAGGMDGTLRLFDLVSETEVHVFTGHTDSVWDCAVSADGAILVSVSWDRTVRLWDIRLRKPLATFSTAAPLRSVALNPCTAQIAYGDMQGQVQVIDVIGLPPAPVTIATTDAAPLSPYS